MGVRVEPRTKALLGALAQQAKHDPKRYTTKARAAFLASFERKVDPENKLDPAERERRAQAAMRLFMLRLSEKALTPARRSWIGQRLSASQDASEIGVSFGRAA